MGFLRRLVGGPTPETFRLPESGYLEVAGLVHHLTDIGAVFGLREERFIENMPVVLRCDPRNQYDPNAIEVRIRGALAGYVPRESAAAWNPQISALEAEGKSVEAMAHVWYRWARGDDPRAYIHLRLADAPPEDRDREREYANREYANRECPYCKAALDPLPKAKKKCPACGNSIYIRAGPDGLTYLLQEVDLPTMEQAWADHRPSRPPGMRCIRPSRPLGGRPTRRCPPAGP